MLWTEKPQSLGGQATAKRSREKAIRGYYENPVQCLACDKVIEVGDQRVCLIRKRKFCNKSCAAIFNNSHVPKRKRACPHCHLCGAEIVCDPKQRRIRCDTCGDALGNKMKKEAHREDISEHARRTYAKTHKDIVCERCSYNFYVEIAHVTPVHKFPGDTLVKVINDPANLKALCRNHHWEFDHGGFKT